MTQKTSLKIPFDSQISDKSGQVSYPWQQWAGQTGDAVSILRDAAQLMTTLNPATATTNDIATAWEAFRVKLQGIV